MKDFSTLKKNLKKDFRLLQPVKIALLGDSATQFLSQALRGLGFDHDFDLQIWEADFNQIERQVFDPTSELYEFKPEIIIIFQSTHKLINKYNKLQPSQYNTLADSQLNLINDLCLTIKSNTSAKIIYYNYPEIDDSVFGNYANKIELSFLFQLRKLNYELMIYATKNPDFYICDIASIQNQVGKNAMFQPSVYIHTEMVLRIDVLPLIAGKTIDLIGSLLGKFKKCLVLDLDNTMWGGVIGDEYLNDELIFEATIVGVFESVNAVEFKFTFKNQESKVVSKGKLQIGLLV